MKRFLRIGCVLTVCWLFTWTAEASATDCDACASEPDCGCVGNDCGSGWSLCDCCLGDAWTLQSCLTPCCDGPTYGGWLSIGYYTDNVRLSAAQGDEASMNDFSHHLNLDQCWFYVERTADANCCCADYGYRFDIMYGAQAFAAQAFGNDGGTWDVTFDNGVYGWAMPQLYGEVAYGDWSVVAGHFFTPAGYEVVPAPGNFFYTHTLTQFNSEPFTHTGVLATYSSTDDLTLYAGWSLGWDTGFDQLGGGSNFIGGFTAQVTCDVQFTYILTAGNFGWRSGNESGYSHHIVLTTDLSPCLTWVAQSDYLNTDNSPDNSTPPAFAEEDVGLTNYLLYTLNDCWSVGGRLEWWRSNYVSGENTSFYDVTGGINYRPHANVVIRPEIRYDWSPTKLYSVITGAPYNDTTFAIDAVFTY